MCLVKEGKNESNTFGEGRGTFPHTPPQTPDLGGIGGGEGRGGDALGEPLVGSSEGKKERMGEERPAQAQDIGLVAPSRMARQAYSASACGATGRVTLSPTRRSAGTGRQCGHIVVPHAMARQRLSVAPEPMVRPNGLHPTIKNQYGLNLKYY